MRRRASAALLLLAMASAPHQALAAGEGLYKRVTIKPKEGDRCFRTAEEARAAGFRASKR